MASFARDPILPVMVPCQDARRVLEATLPIPDCVMKEPEGGETRARFDLLEVDDAEDAVAVLVRATGEEELVVRTVGVTGAILAKL